MGVGHETIMGKPKKRSRLKGDKTADQDQKRRTATDMNGVWEGEDEGEA